MQESKMGVEQNVETVAPGTIDVEHVSHRAGTLLVGAAAYDKSVLDGHHIERIDTQAFDQLKKTKDGKIILIPQPTDDPAQPLNVRTCSLAPNIHANSVCTVQWSWLRKHKILLVLVYCTLMTDLTSAWTIPIIIPQAEYWHITSTNASRNLSGNIFMLGFGCLFAVPLTQWVGRLPILFWAMFLGLCMTIFGAAAPTWISFIVARCLQGFFITAPQAVGLTMIHDLFFFHGELLDPPYLDTCENGCND